MSIARGPAAATAIAATLAGAAAARAADTPAQIVQRPSAATLAAAAARVLPGVRSVTGRAVARCAVSAAGAVSDCVIVASEPTDNPMVSLLRATATSYRSSAPMRPPPTAAASATRRWSFRSPSTRACSRAPR